MACLEALYRSSEGVAHLSVVLVDAGSTDGTLHAVSELFPDVLVISESSFIYWSAGMRIAWEAGQRFDHDLVLWLNDDLALLPNAIESLLLEERFMSATGQKCIMVGKVLSPSTGEVTYGGFRRRPGSISKLSWQHLEVDHSGCDTMNGNCVLLPRECFTVIGNFSRKFSHSFGDIDYGLRACKAGYTILQSVATVGYQERSSQIYSGQRLKVSFHNMRKIMNDPKGIPLAEWLYFCKTHGGRLWPINFALRYVTAFRNF